MGHDEPRPKRKLRKKPTLEELIAQITPANRHAEVDWGKPRGKEVR